MTSKTITLFNKTIRQDDSGRYCLNDLHKAAMANGQATKNHRPTEFLRSEPVKEFVNILEIGQKENPLSTIKTTKGRSGGTFSTKPVAIEYFRWLCGAQASVMLCEKIASLDSLLEALDDFDVPDDLPDMYVYAIREAETGRIKIGISKDPAERLKQLQVGNSQELELIAYKKAGNRFSDERAAHLINSDSHIRGEWFEAEASIQ